MVELKKKRRKAEKDMKKKERHIEKEERYFMAKAETQQRQRAAFREARIGKLAQETVDEMNFDWWYHKCIKDKRVVGPWCQKARDARRSTKGIMAGSKRPVHKARPGNQCRI